MLRLAGRYDQIAPDANHKHVVCRGATLSCRLSNISSGNLDKASWERINEAVTNGNGKAWIVAFEDDLLSLFFE